MNDSTRPPWLPLGSLLVRERLITSEQLELALLEQQQLKWRLGEILVNWGWVTTQEIAFALAEQYGISGLLFLVGIAFSAITLGLVALTVSPLFEQLTRVLFDRLRARAKKDRRR